MTAEHTSVSRRAFVQRAAGWLSVSGLVLLGGACSKSRDELEHDASHEVHWAYDGAQGPNEWGQLSPHYAVCSSGAAQSPIDLDAMEAGTGGHVVFKWRPETLAVTNNGHTVQAEVGKGSSIEIDGVTFALLQFHFHAPSEHTVQGKSFPLEAHFVHQSAKGEPAVVGVLYSAGEANSTLTDIIRAVPSSIDQKKSLPAADCTALLPRERSMFRYSGSLTTPPCTEGVRWQVLQTPVTASNEQISQLQALLHANARPVQPLKGRTVTRDQS
jgi:carbonic anhydrase